MSAKKIRWIFFDIGGVILDDTEPERLRQEALLNVLKDYLPDITIQDIYKAWLLASTQPGSVRIQALRELMKNSPNLQEAEEKYKEVCNYDYLGSSKIRPEAKSVLEQLSKKYNLGVMANQSTKTTQLLEAAGLLPFLSHQIMSGHVGLEKPNPDFFKSIIADSGAKAEESILVDDNWYRGLAPAQSLGMSTILYCRDIIPVPVDAVPDFRINNLKELLDKF